MHMTEQPRPTKEQLRHWIAQARREACAAGMERWRLLVAWRGDHWDTGIIAEELYRLNVHRVGPVLWTAVDPQTEP
jgi:hypothetical protein